MSHLRKACLLRSLKNSLYFCKYPLIHFYHKSLLDSKSFVSGKYFRKIPMCCFFFFIFFFLSGFWVMSWAIVSVLWFPNIFLFGTFLRKVLPMNPFANMHIGRLPFQNQIRVADILHNICLLRLNFGKTCSTNPWSWLGTETPHSAVM